MLTPDLGPEVATAFGVGGATADGADAVLAGPVASGRMGDVWRLDTSQGRFAVKESFDGWRPEDAEQDAAYQDAVRAAGVPMPAVVRTTGGSVLADIGGTQVRVYDWVDLLGPDRSLDPEVVGRTVARIHSVGGPTTQPVSPWSWEPVGPDAWQDIVVRLTAAGAPFALGLADLVPDVLETEALLVPPDDRQWCHLDLWADNVLATPDGGITVLDWENSGPGSPSHELVVVLYEFGCGEPDRMRSLYAAYVAAGGPARVTGRADATMLVAQLGHIAMEGSRRWLAATTDAQREDNAAWVGEFVEDPVTVGTIDGILDAVSAR